jgi:hypothetical protein
MSFDPSSLFQNVLDWTEKHAGLGGWVGAIGAVIAIFVTWGLARAEYLRTRRQEKTKRRTEIDQMIIIISAFEAHVDYFKGFGEDPYSQTAHFFSRNTEKAEFRAMMDLAMMSVREWPSLEIYTEFRRYWYSSQRFMEPESYSIITGDTYSNLRMVHDDAIAKLMELLQKTRSS